MSLPPDSSLSAEKLRSILLEAAPSLPPLGDCATSITAGNTPISPGDVIQDCWGQSPKVSDFRIIIECDPRNDRFICYHPFSGEYTVVWREHLDQDLREEERVHHENIL